MTTERVPPECWLTDMDGVLVHEERALPGAAEFLERLIARQRRFLVLTNNSIFTPRDLSARLVRAGLHSPEGPLPATGSVAAMITRATGAEPYFVGKPNPMMFRSAMNRIEAHSESTVMIGDRMDTDVVAGIEAGLETILVLTGSTQAADIARFPFRPGRVLDSIADVIELV